MKGLEPDARSLAGLKKTLEDSNLTRHVNFVDIPDNSEVDPQKNNNNSTSLIIEVACVADEQEENFLNAAENTEEINTDDGLRSAIVIDPGLSFPERREESQKTACLENTRGNLEIEQMEAPVREMEKVFDGDIAAEIVEPGDSTKATEIAPSLKLGSLKKKRKPRYYDFPDSNLQMCHKDDHIAEECTMVRRKKPCYLCGVFGHTGKRCSQGRECFKCGGRGHLARDCLEEPSSNKITDFCLKCGDSGHHMFVCQNKYSSEDLKHIQCYVCKDFGHLCCDSFEYKGQTVASCYYCGQSGHLGSECMRQENCTRYTVAKSFCKYEVKGHFAGDNRDCNKAGQCTLKSTTVETSFSDKEILPNFPHEPLISGQGVPSNQG
ncbi:uncharacterized protein LOC108225412 isoform X2 [Daucus carota subsp. sativus]|uniref:uncharacterized protein LOC108225412 isoform X2 n=1 Tax=Daucus carota subsp. sativus TaxID=79200 RepID=UPI0007EF83D6|nr:PREDICTED: uncharacterized protein LOC108225412 isoform X1 [Daucus carota subsp. sativus]